MIPKDNWKKTNFLGYKLSELVITLPFDRNKVCMVLAKIIANNFFFCFSLHWDKKTSSKKIAEPVKDGIVRAEKKIKIFHQKGISGAGETNK